MLSREHILQAIREKIHHPASPRELMQVLKVPREERAGFSRHLEALVETGDLVQIRGNRFGLPDKMDLIVGRLQTNPAGYGFVVPERPIDGGGDIYVAAANLKEAMHGDRVVARIEHVRDDKRAEGRIVRVLERGASTIVGRYEKDESGLGFIVPFDQRVLVNVHVPAGEERGATTGQMVVVDIVRWPTAARGPIGRVSEVLGTIDAPGVDTRIVISKHGLPDQHSEQAVEEARRLTGGRGAARAMNAAKQDVAGRVDFRSRPIVTIDGEHARDFDDAVSVERLPNGNYLLGVHIADVSHYVKEGSALDRDAYERGTSVYFPERAIHMFPEELATGLCSLNPHVDRLVQSCVMEVDRQGGVVRHELHDGVINTAERMTYTDVNAILTGTDVATTARYGPLVPMFHLMEELFHALNDRRRRLGSVDFDLEEAEVRLDEEGRIEAIIASERNIAHRIIEELMLLANETVAQFLDGRGLPGLYRVHEDPDPLKVARFEEFISTFGYSLATRPEQVRPRHFQRLLGRLKGKLEEKPIAALMLRTMQKARYAPENLGHFGLAFSSYTHFTSPIRRYPDLVVHRLLREGRSGEMAGVRRDELDEELPEIARHTSDRERRAEEAERELLQWKKVRFMRDKVGDEFEGYVTGVAPFGLFVELVEHFVEGLVHVSSMADDYYRYAEGAHALRGENTQKVYRLGDRVRVQVVRVDLERRMIDLGLVEILDAVRADERRRGAKRSTARPAREQRVRASRPGRRERTHARRGKGRRR
jgi:ribonuclease R